MLADSQLFPPRLRPNVAVVYSILNRNANKVTTYEEINQVLYISKRTICQYVVQIREIMGAKIDVVYKVGYVLRTQ